LREEEKGGREGGRDVRGHVRGDTRKTINESINQSYPEPLGRDVTNGSFDVVWDPLHEVGGVFVHHIEHLFVDLLGGHAPAEHAGAGQVPREGRKEGGREGGRGEGNVRESGLW